MGMISSPRLEPRKKQQPEERTLTTSAPSLDRLVSRIKTIFSPSSVANFLPIRFRLSQPTPKSIEALLKSQLNTPREKRQLIRFLHRSRLEDPSEYDSIVNHLS